MAGKQTIQGEVEADCSPHKVLEMFRGKQEHVPNICSDKITSVNAHHDDWITVGSTTRTWNYVHEGEPRYVTERIESVDEENNTICFTFIDGDVMKLYYRSFTTKLEAIPKGEGCLLKWTIEYEKLNEDAPEPQDELSLLVGLVKDLGDHHAKAKA